MVKEDTFGRLGVAVCKFVPGQFMAMGDFDVLALPAAFTQKTWRAFGTHYWQPAVLKISVM